MPIHLFWGEDEFLLGREVTQLRSCLIDRAWQDFNYNEYAPNSLDSIPQALADINTPPIGNGGRLVYLPSSSLLGATSKEMLQQLESILPNIPATNVLLITSTTKPDSRIDAPTAEAGDSQFIERTCSTRLSPSRVEVFSP